MASYTSRMHSIAAALARKLQSMAVPRSQATYHYGSMKPVRHHRSPVYYSQIQLARSRIQATREYQTFMPVITVDTCRNCKSSSLLLDQCRTCVSKADVSVSSQLLTPEQGDPLAQVPHIEFLEELDKSNIDSYSAKDLFECTSQLYEYFYKDARRHFSWLDPGARRAYIQLEQVDRLEELTNHLRHHPNFIALYSKLRQSASELDHRQLPGVLFSLVCLRVSHEDPLVHQLLFEMRRLIPEMDVMSLYDAAMVLKVMPRYDTITIRMFMKRFSDISEPDRKLSPTELEFFSKIYTLLVYYMAFDRVFTYVTVMERHLYDASYSGNLKVSTSFIVAFNKACKGGLVMPCVHRIKDLLVECEKHWVDQVDIMDDVDLSKVLMILNPALRYRGHKAMLQQKCEQRAIQILSNSGDKLNIYTVNNLLFLFHKRSAPWKLRVLEDAFYNVLEEEIDMTLLGIISTTALRFDFSQKTYDRLQHIAAVQAKLLPTSTHLGAGRVLNLFIERPANEDVKDLFCEGVLKFLNSKSYVNQYGIDIVVYLAIFLLCQSNLAGVSENVMKNVVAGISVMQNLSTFRALSMMDQALSGADIITNPRARYQFETIKGLLYSRLAKLRKNIVGLSTLNGLTQMKFSTNSHIVQDSDFLMLLEAHMQLYAKFTSNFECLHEPKLFNTLKILNKICYYSPEIYDNLVTSTIQQQDFLLKFTFVSLIRCLSKAGYRPPDMEDLHRIADRTLDGLMAWNDPNKEEMLVSLLRELTNLQYFPEKHLLAVFNLEFITLWDSKIKRSTTICK